MYKKMLKTSLKKVIFVLYWPAILSKKFRHLKSTETIKIIKVFTRFS